MVLVATSQCGDIMKHEHRRDQRWWWGHQYLGLGHRPTHPGTTASHARISLAEKTAAVTKYTALVPGWRGDQALSCDQRKVSHRCRVMK